uniref:HAT C-terminal dimerisation domain-containing protein n=1 Tax=Xiphophorus maculatus TaxID=8083 RepID=A0A3B5QDM3_XIPMA
NFWQETKTEYGTLMPNQDNADAELELWRQANDKDNKDKNSKICQVLKDMVDFLSNLHTVLKVLLTMTVSTTSAEQNFSTLRYLKMYLRSTVLDTRLTGRALMNEHSHQHYILPSLHIRLLINVSLLRSKPTLNRRVFS